MCKLRRRLISFYFPIHMNEYMCIHTPRQYRTCCGKAALWKSKFGSFSGSLSNNQLSSSAIKSDSKLHPPPPCHHKTMASVGSVSPPAAARAATTTTTKISRPPAAARATGGSTRSVRPFRRKQRGWIFRIAGITNYGEKEQREARVSGMPVVPVRETATKHALKRDGIGLRGGLHRGRRNVLHRRRRWCWCWW